MNQSWNGHKMTEFSFEGYEAKIVFPADELARNILVLKMEYWNAFPEAAFRLRLWSGSAHLHGSGKGRYYL